MFEGKSEKGLFTFYWEEAQFWGTSQHSNTKMSFSPPQSKPYFIDQKTMEEKKLTKKHKTKHIHHAEQSKSIDQLILGRSDQLNVSMKPRQDKIDELQSIPKNKGKKQKENAASNKNLPFIKKEYKNLPTTTLDDELFEKLMTKEMAAIEYHRCTIEISEQFKKYNKNKVNSLQKSTILVQSKPKELNFANQSKKCATVIIDPMDINCILPVVHKTRHNRYKTKQTKSKEIEQVVVQRCCLKPSNSVINIGASSQYQYHDRWKRRKEEFLTLLNCSNSNPVSKR